MKQVIRIIGCIFLLVAIIAENIAQPAELPVKIVVTPDHVNWEYKMGEMAGFSVTVLKNHVPVNGVKVTYEVGPERMLPLRKASAILQNGTMRIDGVTMKTPGFLRCLVVAEVDGKSYRNMATVGYNILDIQPSVSEPADFEAFWEKGKQELASIPADIRMTLLPERSTANTNVYHVNAQGYANSRLFGILCVPKKEGKYPAVFQVPGAGIRPYNPDLEIAEKGFIVFTIGIHGIPVNLEPQVYSSLESGALKGYFFFNAEQKDRYYYKRVYLNCVRGIDVIAQLPQFNGKELAVSGNSQGGALSIITAALDQRVKYLAAVHPALCDLTGYFQERAGGWPHIFGPNNLWFSNNTAVKETIPYYDVVNFAKRVNIPGYYTWGFNDETCPPTSMYAAFNVIKSPKHAEVYHDSGHWMYAEQKQAFNNWIIKQLGN
jgi:cephalosporin-C deacetylase